MEILEWNDLINKNYEELQKIKKGLLAEKAEKETRRIMLIRQIMALQEME